MKLLNKLIITENQLLILSQTSWKKCAHHQRVHPQYLLKHNKSVRQPLEELKKEPLNKNDDEGKL
jgi:hypothetical protein